MVQRGAQTDSKREKKLVLGHDRYAHCAVLNGSETVQSVAALIQFADLDGTIARTMNTHWTIQGSPYRIRHFVVGDHSLQYKVNGANGPGSERDTMECCPWCSLPPKYVKCWGKPGLSPLVELPRATAMVQAIPRSQCVPDAMHGQHNLLHNVFLELFIRILQQQGNCSTAEATRNKECFKIKLQINHLITWKRNAFLQ